MLCCYVSHVSNVATDINAHVNYIPHANRQRATILHPGGIYRYQYLDEHTLDEFKKEIGLLSQARPAVHSHEHHTRTRRRPAVSEAIRGRVLVCFEGSVPIVKHTAARSSCGIW